MSSPLVRIFAACCFWLAVATAGLDAAAQAVDAAAGTRVIDFIASLREAGLTIVASSELVPDTMRVMETAPPGEPLDRLRTVLAPYGLDLERGPRGSWLVVRARRAETPAPPRPPPLAIAPPQIETIVVTASRYTLRRSTSPSSERIDRVRLDHVPVLGDDALRAAHGLPGVTSSGLSARMSVRGGVSDETLFLLDGVRLYNPFHLKDFESLFSGLSPRMIDHIDVHAGGYSARYGDRMSGVVELATIDAAARRRYELGVSTLTTSFQSSGQFAEQRGQWLTSIRRGNLDLLIDAAGSDFGTPQYTDLFTKLDYELGSGVIGVGVLVLDDKIALTDSPDALASADYDDAYTWLSFEHSPTARLDARYLLSRAQLGSARSGRVSRPDVVDGTLRDDRHFDVDTIEADWALSLSDTQRFEWGAQYSRARASYRFASTRSVPHAIRVADWVPTAAAITFAARPDERRAALFVNYRRELTPRATLELGYRWDAQSLVDDEQTSPRLGILFDVGERTTLRGSWGRYFQSQSLNELVIDSDQATFERAQRSEHRIVGLEHLLGEALSLRLEAYDKRFDDVGTRLENLFERVSLVPELLPDRVALTPARARARGVEVGVEGGAQRWRWWLSLARSSVDDEIAGRQVRRSWEEPWSGKAGFIWSGMRWSASALLTLRSGWPISPLELVDGELLVRRPNGEAFETFRSLDARISRRFALRRGTLEWLLELNNATNYDNKCCFDYSVTTSATGAIVDLRTDTASWLPGVPTLGFLWTFGSATP